MVFEPFEATFAYNGETLTSGSVKLSVSACKIEGVDFEVPKNYAYLLLHEKTDAEGWRFLKELSESTLCGDICTRLLDEVCSKGFPQPRRMLQEFNHEAPQGKSRFYAEIGYDWKAQPSHLILTDGKRGFRFYTSADLYDVCQTLPPNVYCLPEYMGFSLALERYRSTLGHEGKLFSFMKKLSLAGDYTRHETRDKCFRRFFEDKAEAYKMLKQMLKDADHRKRRDELYERFEKRKLLEFQGGFFVHTFQNTYYVSEDGEVYELEYEKEVEEREALLRAFERGMLPKKMMSVEDEAALREVAEIVGKIKPELAVVMLP